MGRGPKPPSKKRQGLAVRASHMGPNQLADVASDTRGVLHCRAEVDADAPTHLAGHPSATVRHLVSKGARVSRARDGLA